jgi:hypothetical protein
MSERVGVAQHPGCLMRAPGGPTSAQFLRTLVANLGDDALTITTDTWPICTYGGMAVVPCDVVAARIVLCRT